MTSTPARLNVFQRTMLHWNDLHPYNAVHVLRIEAPFNFERLSHTIKEELCASGLGQIEISSNRKTFRYASTPADCEIRQLSGDGDPTLNLATEIRRQLNRAFDHHQPFSPFRFFALPDTDGFLLGLVYFHPVADAESVAHLLRRIAAALVGEPRPAVSLELYPPSPDRLIRRPGILFNKFTSLPTQIRNLRRSFRAPCRDANVGENGFALLSLTAAELESLVTLAKSRSVTVNDLFLALLLKCLSPLAAGRRTASKRRLLSAGCVVNTRRDLGMDGSRIFGLFLGSFVVSHEVPDEMSLGDLAQAIQRQTARIKRNRLYLGAALEMAAAGQLLGFFSTARRKKLYLKNYPLWGGITNMNLNALWPGSEQAPIVDYFRAVSSGPVTPLVLSVTTFGERANLGLTYRTAVFTEAMVADLQQNLLKLVRELPSSP